MSLKPIKIGQQVTVEISQYDNDLQNLIRKIVGAPRGAYVCINEKGVRVTWSRRKRAPKLN